jgi:hypothetical protein
VISKAKVKVITVLLIDKRPDAIAVLEWSIAMQDGGVMPR